MKELPLRATAFLVAQQLAPATTVIYDFRAGRTFGFTGTATLTAVDLVDQQSESQIVGYGNGNSLVLRQLKTGDQFTVNLYDGRFSGYDFGSGKPYLGCSRGSLIQFYDYEQKAFLFYRF